LITEQALGAPETRERVANVALPCRKPLI